MKEIRKQQEMSFKREMVIKVALKLFHKKGFQNTSVAEIAREVGYCKGTIYIYFKNKNEILHAIHDQMENKFLENFEKIVDSKKKFMEKLENFVELLVYSFQNMTNKNTVFYLEIMQSQVRRIINNPNFMHKKMSILNDLYKRLIISAKQEKIFSSELSTDYYAMLFDMCISGIFEYCFAKRIFSNNGDRDIKKIIRHFFQIFITGIQNTN